MKYITFLIYGVFAMFAGVIGHLLRSINAEKRPSIVRTLIEGFSAGFVGILIALVCHAMHLGDEWTGVIVGVSGWLGATTTIQLLEKIINKKLGLN